MRVSNPPAASVSKKAAIRRVPPLVITLLLVAFVQSCLFSCSRLCFQAAPTAFALSRERKRYGVLMDGDVIGPNHWSQVLKAVRKKGDVAHAHVFLSPADTCSQDRLSPLGITPIFVPRGEGGAKDPNDIAIGMEAARLVTQGKVTSIALGVADKDFVYLARRLQHWGHDVLLVMLENKSRSVVKAFREAQVDVVTYSVWYRKPKFYATFALHSNGESTFDGLVEALPDLDGAEACESFVKDMLHALGFLDNLEYPLIPAIAKCFHTNSLGPLTVGVRCVSQAVSQANDAFIAHYNRSWVLSTGDLAFVHPLGTQTAESAVGCPGPFIVRDSDKLVELILSRLNYLDNAMNADIDEAIDVFCQTGANKRTLEGLGVHIDSSVDTHLKGAVLRDALLSPKARGTWKLAPSDKCVRQRLAADGMISDRQAPTSEVFKALGAVANQFNIPLRKTYNGRVQVTLQHENSVHPDLRR
mmetsp:Transcript_81430/g.174325  ORF Transcript_81430/g.174325 Transcript_81430/m.174325 type:complete len:472 (+) Transcript_81430:73-1488(+)